MLLFLSKMAEDIQKAIEYVRSAKKKVHWAFISDLDRVENKLKEIGYNIKKEETGEWEAKLSERIRKNRPLYEFALALFEIVGYDAFSSAEVWKLYFDAINDIPEKFRGEVSINPYPTLVRNGILEKETIRPHRTYNYRFHPEAVELIKKELGY
jgi:hypothetical protein